jgi:FimV-like protein
MDASLLEMATLNEAQHATPMPDLEELDDDSVSKLYESISSVERPSKVLDEYPELELGEDSDMEDLIFPDDSELLAQDIDLSLPSMDLMHESGDPEPAVLAELSELEDTNFDEMLLALDELQVDVLQVEERPDSETQNTHTNQNFVVPTAVEPPAKNTAEHDLPDFVHIDKLLAATEDDIEAEMTPGLRIDVGLADFEDLIAADEMGDVDQADAGFAGQLDLIRAYNEIGDSDSAQQLIKEILASDAPAHVKQEAIHLQNS